MEKIALKVVNKISAAEDEAKKSKEGSEEKTKVNETDSKVESPQNEVK